MVEVLSLWAGLEGLLPAELGLGQLLQAEVLPSSAEPSSSSPFSSFFSLLPESLAGLPFSVVRVLDRFVGSLEEQPRVVEWQL